MCVRERDRNMILKSERGWGQIPTSPLAITRAMCMSEQNCQCIHLGDGEIFLSQPKWLEPLTGQWSWPFPRAIRQDG